MTPPIIILGMPRGGTSMTAGLFAKHDVWIGRCRKPDKLNPKGYFENLDFKDEFVKRFGRIAQSGETSTHQDDWSEIVKGIAPKEDRWLVKSTAMYWPTWVEFDPWFVCARRDPVKVVQSGLKTGFYDSENPLWVAWLVNRHNEEMDRIVDDHGGVNVYVDQLVKSDLTSLSRAFEYCGLALNEKIATEFIDPDLMS